MGKRKLQLPDDILGIIRAFSKPIGTRLDWRTCKRIESVRIKMSNRALYLWYKWFIGETNTLLFSEISRWTFYGRRHLLWVSRIRPWTFVNILQAPEEDDPEYYEKRFMIQGEWPVFGIGSIEYNMSQVSMIV